MSYVPVVNKIWFCVFRRSSSRNVACFCISLAFKAFLSLFIIITLTSLVNCRNEEQELYKAMWRKLWGKRARLQCPNTEKWRPYTQTPHATKPQVHRILLSHPLQISHIQSWLNGYWTMLMTERDSIRLRLKAYRVIIFTKFEPYISQKVQKAKSESRKHESRNRDSFRCAISA